MVKKEMSFRDLLSRVSGSLFVWRSRTILVEGVMRNSFEIILHLDQWFRRCFLSRALVLRGTILVEGSTRTLL